MSTSSRSRALLTASVLVLAACGGERETSETSTEPGSPETATPAVTSTPQRPTTTAASSTTTTSTTAPATTQVPHQSILRPDGLGPVDFGTPADAAIGRLTDLLGPPDLSETVDPDQLECVEGSEWRDCLAVVNQGSIITWNIWGLEVLVTDHGGWNGATPRIVPLHLGSWRATRSTTGNSLTSADGLRPGLTVGELRTLFPDVEFGYGEGIIAGYSIVTLAGDYWGELDWDPASPDNSWPELVRAVQRSLNRHGATLTVDGEWGPLSQQAWELFIRDHDLGPAPPTMWLTQEIGQALEMPPDDFAVATAEATL